MAPRMSKEAPANAYSANWFEIFLPPSAAVAPEQEIEFLRRWLPLPAHRRVLDLCCGIGRHAHALSGSGFVVTGLDRNLQALRSAAAKGRGVRYLLGDMRCIPLADGSFDAVVCLWQSFGYFDAATNRQVLRAIRNILAPHGRLILDVYRSRFFEAHQGCRRIPKDSHEIVERRRMVGDRLQVELNYGEGAGFDRFDWQLFEPDDLCELARLEHFLPMVVCTDFESSKTASQDHARMQLVFEAM